MSTFAVDVLLKVVRDTNQRILLWHVKNAELVGLDMATLVLIIMFILKRTK